MEKLKDFLVSHYFIRVKNGRFLVVEGAFIYMIFAMIIGVIGSLVFFNKWWIIPFIIPFAYGAYFAAFHPKIKDIDEVPGWRTRLKVLKDPKMAHKFNTPYDKLTEDRLEERWQNEYNEDYDAKRYVFLQAKQPILYVVLIVIIGLLWM